MNKEITRFPLGYVTSIDIKEDRVVINADKIVTVFYSHDQDCCENVFADLGVFKDYNKDIIGKNIKDLVLKEVNGIGFLMNFYRDYDDSVKVFIPCYNYQNGYYSSDLKLVINIDDDYKREYMSFDISHLVEDHID